jgi:hypothetical protein
MNLNTSLSNIFHRGQGNPPARWLNIVYLVVAVVIIALGALAIAPAVLPQFGGGQTQSQGPAGNKQPAAAKAALTTTPTSTPTLPSTPTSLPTLTPAPTETEIVLVTPIIYATADSSTPVNCTVTASTTLNLRADPSVNRRAIGRVMAGSVLPVTGCSADQKWWRVINNAGNAEVEGWVSAQYVKADKTCADEAIPVAGPTLTPTRTPRSR